MYSQEGDEYFTKFYLLYIFLNVYKLQEDTFSREKYRWTEGSGFQFVVKENNWCADTKNLKEDEGIQW